MKILFVPNINGNKEQQIAMYVLYRRYFSRVENISPAFLLPAVDHKPFKEKGINILDIDYAIPQEGNGLSQLRLAKGLIDKVDKAVNTFYPDLIVEDFDYFCGIICKKYLIPHISIRRTGLFRSTNPLFRNNNHVHSMEKDPINGVSHKILHYKESPILPQVGVEYLDDEYYFPKLQPLSTSPDSFLKSNVNIIPGIRSIEILPPTGNQESYFYCGPLYAKDNPTNALQKMLSQFFEQNTIRKKVFVTTSVVEKKDVSDVISLLLQKDFAVVSTSPHSDPDLKDNRFFFNSVLPFGLVCSAVDLVVHHGGPGVYHHPLLNLKPTITIGTQCYDHEEVALQLEALHISAHTPSPQDDPRYMEVFKYNLEKFEKGNLCDFDKLEKIRDEVITTMLSFDVEKVIDFTLDL